MGTGRLVEERRHSDLFQRDLRNEHSPCISKTLSSFMTETTTEYAVFLPGQATQVRKRLILERILFIYMYETQLRKEPKSTTYRRSARLDSSDSLPRIWHEALSADRNQWLLPVAAVIGADLMLLADCIGRIIIIPREVPVGVMTAIIDAPYFIYLLQKERKRRSASSQAFIKGFRERDVVLCNVPFLFKDRFP